MRICEKLYDSKENNFLMESNLIRPMQTQIDAKMTTVDLTGAVIRFAELEGVNLNYANLTNCDFSHSSLFGADLSGAILNGAKLFNTDLQQANLENTQLKNVDFSQCRVAGAIFANAEGLSRSQKRWLKNNGALDVF